MPVKNKNYISTRLPFFAIAILVVLAVIPTALIALNYNPLSFFYKQNFYSNLPILKNESFNGINLSYLIVIQWSSFLLSIFAGTLSLTKYYSTKENSALLLAMFFISSGFNDLFYIITCCGIFGDSNSIEILIPFIWFINRTITALIFAGCSFALLFRIYIRIKVNAIIIAIFVIANLVVMYLIYSSIAIQQKLPLMIDSKSLIKNYWEFIPLTISLLSCVLLFIIYKRNSTIFNHSIFIISIVYLLPQIHLLVGVSELSSIPFLGSHYLKVLIYALPCYGLILDYFDTIRRAYATSDAKTSFLANMSHEIRTPINGILCTSEMLMDDDDGNLNDDEKENLEIIQESANALLSIVNNILEFSKVEKGEVQLDNLPYSLNNLTQFVYNSFNNLAQSKKLFFNVQIDENLPDIIIGDLFRVKQILMNLVGNAMKFTEQGSISILVKKVIEDGHPRLHFSVKDTGIGIKKDNFSKLFLEFNQLDNSVTRKFGGTGLGLSICRNLAKLMKGKIHIRSDFGNGSTFTLSLPLDLPIQKDQMNIDQDTPDNLSDNANLNNNI
ncbi:MAG: hypothetical protein COA79_06640 [Planctomycetota bacterium]|nr:MAG: hypothetical protein COA79_06640 [Planctomycetota bacterium]